MTDFPTLLYTYLVKSVHIPEAWKRHSFWAEPSRIGHQTEYPPLPPPPATSPRVVNAECSLVRHFEDAIIRLLIISKCLFNFNVIWFCVSPPDCPLDPWSACWKHRVSFDCKDIAVRTKWIKAVCGPNSKKTSLFAWYGDFCECGWFLSNLKM